MESVQLAVKERADKGTAACRRLRKGGEVPVVLYGMDRSVRPFSCSAHSLTQLVEKGFHIVELDFEGHSQVALVKDVQWDAIGQRIVHADFQRVNRDQKVHVYVPVRFIGTAPGVAGSVVDKILDAVQVEVLPLEIPDGFVVNLASLELGQHITVGELGIPDNCKPYNHNLDDTVVTHHMKAHQQDDEDDAEGEGEEGELPEGGEVPPPAEE